MTCPQTFSFLYYVCNIYCIRWHPQTLSYSCIMSVIYTVLYDFPKTFPYSPLDNIANKNFVYSCILLLWMLRMFWYERIKSDSSLAFGRKILTPLNNFMGCDLFLINLIYLNKPLWIPADGLKNYWMSTKGRGFWLDTTLCKVWSGCKVSSACLSQQILTLYISRIMGKEPSKHMWTAKLQVSLHILSCQNLCCSLL